MPDGHHDCPQQVSAHGRRGGTRPYFASNKRGGDYTGILVPYPVLVGAKGEQKAKRIVCYIRSLDIYKEFFLARGLLEIL